VTVLLFILGVFFVVVGIVASIALHEVGHLVPAKLFKVRVMQYMIGFGPTMWSRKRGETEYGVKAIPAGGYVSMVGMYPPAEQDGTVRPSSTGMFQSLADDARKLAAEQVQPGDEHRMFYKLPVWKRIVIMLGGPFMNLVIGVVLFAVVIMGFGSAQVTTTLAEVHKCVVPASQQAETGQQDCLPSDPKAPASAAGLKPGDTIVSFDGQPVEDWQQMTERIRQAAGDETQITVLRNGERIQSEITPLLTERPVVGDDGRAEVDGNGNPVMEKVGFVGMGAQVELVPQPATEVLPAVGENIARVTGVVVNLPEHLYEVGQAAFSEEPRDPNGPISVVGVGRVAGEVASMDEIAAESKFAMLFRLMAGVNLALCVFNLIPLLPLDGGHVAGALWEGLRRRIAKLFGRKDPGPFDIAKLLPLTYVVAVALLGMGALLVYADIVKPVNLFG
jgi:membrane-associated protease RseP (regulator of RpoE activity)